MLKTSKIIIYDEPTVPQIKLEKLAKFITDTFSVKVETRENIFLKLDEEDYKKISSIPNVKLVHPNTNNQELIAKSQGVIVISGSTGFEALFHKKPVILFSQDHYDSLSMVTKIDSITNLPHHIRDSIQNFEFKPLELNALMKVYDELSLLVPYSSMLKDGNVLSSIQRYENDLSLTQKEFKKFYETYEKYFELIASDIITKI